MSNSIDVLNIAPDGRVNCISYLTLISIKDYISLVQRAYTNKGGIEGQRDALRTSTATRIRNRMIDDIQAGAILPPLVLGSLSRGNDFPSVNEINKENAISYLDMESIAIIDGMQRTTAIMHAFSNRPEISDNLLRVEFWLAKDTNSLLYRMLVLNTGQVPWNLKKQVEVVFGSMIKEISSNCPHAVLLSQGKRRSAGGQFQNDTAVEMYLSFGSRKENVDTKERLTDEFVKLDFIEATSSNDFNTKFFTIFDRLAEIDRELDKFTPQAPPERDASIDNEGRFVKGRDLFSSQPACVGFVTAVAEKVYGRPGIERSDEESEENFNSVIIGITSLIDRLRSMTQEDVENFLDFATLNHAISARSSKVSVGTHQRTYFKNAFRVLIDENFSLKDLKPAWRA